MNKGITDIQIINAVLELIAESEVPLWYIDVVNILKIDKIPELNNRINLSDKLIYDTQIILDKLCRDGYVEKIDRISKIHYDYYKIRWGGKQFSKQGGYLEPSLSEDLPHKKPNLIQAITKSKRSKAHKIFSVTFKNLKKYAEQIIIGLIIALLAAIILHFKFGIGWEERNPLDFAPPLRHFFINLFSPLPTHAANATWKIFGRKLKIFSLPQANLFKYNIELYKFLIIQCLKTFPVMIFLWEIIIWADGTHKKTITGKMEIQNPYN